MAAWPGLPRYRREDASPSATARIRLHKPRPSLMPTLLTAILAFAWGSHPNIAVAQDEGAEDESQIDDTDATADEPAEEDNAGDQQDDAAQAEQDESPRTTTIGATGKRRRRPAGRFRAGRAGRSTANDDESAQGNDAGDQQDDSAQTGRTNRPRTATSRRRTTMEAMTATTWPTTAGPMTGPNRRPRRTKSFRPTTPGSARTRSVDGRGRGPAAGDSVGGGGMPTIRTTKRSSGHAAGKPRESRRRQGHRLFLRRIAGRGPFGAVAGGNPVSGRAAETRRQALSRQRQHYCGGALIAPDWW